MARSSGIAVENNFVNGLITEATGMNFPENACTDASNVIFNETGEVTRRLGFDYEYSYTAKAITRSSSAIVEYEWKAAGGDGSVNFIVQQVGDTIYFYRQSDTTALSDGIHATTFSLSTFAVAGAPATAGEPCSFASGKGYLFVTHKYCEPFYIVYTVATNALAATAITIQCRDFEGVDDGLEITENPATLSDAHEYNLFNQGWTGPARYNNSPGALYTNPILTYQASTGSYPNNTEVIWTIKNASGFFDPTYTYSEIAGNSLAPKGYFILNWFNTDRSGADSRVGTVTERTAGYYRPSCCAFFAGRVWYAGVESNSYIGEVYYSQIIERDEQLGQCYQTNDPTSENLSDLLDTDGGIARVLDIGTIYKMISTQKALILLASNGVWAISGSDVASFKATDYTIKKISSMILSSGLSYVDAMGTPLFWSDDGIWTIAYEGGDFTVVSLSDKKIQQFFKNIPRESRKWAKGAFNSVDRLVQWVYSNTAPTTVDERYTYDRILTMNTGTGAFYPWSNESTTTKIHGIVAIPCYTNSTLQTDFKYFVDENTSGSTYSSTFAEAKNADYLDWVGNSESLNYSSYFISGYRIHGEGSREYQANYVTFICTDVTGASAFVQGVWDFANNTLSKKWTTAQQIYNSTPTYRNYRIRKIKIRGWGKALQFRIYSAQGLPFKIVGWSAFETANPLP